jgi:hypothetical protein
MYRSLAYGIPFRIRLPTYNRQIFLRQTTKDRFRQGKIYPINGRWKTPQSLVLRAHDANLQLQLDLISLIVVEQFAELPFEYDASRKREV